MGEIPYIKFSGKDTEEWTLMSQKVSLACETHGCFLMEFTNFPNHLHQIFMPMKSLFDLPEETKKKLVSPKAYRSYSSNCPKVPLLQSFSIDDSTQFDAAVAFTNLMWPEGNSSFCDALYSVSCKMSEVNMMVLKMIMESLGIEKQYYDMHVNSNENVIRLMKYKVPSKDEESTNLGLLPHTDKTFLTILCQNEVHGFEFLSKQGNWIQVNAPPNCFIVIVGDALQAWSNGRFDAARHRVVMNGEKDRYSCGLFSVPKDGVTIEVPNELIDNDHPLRYRPFKYQDYFSYFVSNLSDDALDTFARI